VSLCKHTTRSLSVAELRPPCYPEIVLQFVIVLVIENCDLIITWEEKIVKNKRSVDAFPVFRLQTALHTQIQLHHRL
jgi:hypothetical protein